MLLAAMKKLLLVSMLVPLAACAGTSYRGSAGPLFADVSISHAASAFSAMMMSGLAVVGLVLRSVSRVFRTVSWISLLLLVVYLLNTLFLYLYGH